MTAPSRFDVWAPAARTVALLAGGTRYPLVRRPDDVAPGWWGLPDVPDALTADTVDYGYLLDDADRPLPDPRSRWQPDGVHGLSRTYDHTAYAWGDGAWTGRQLAGSVIYELHIGTFTPEGTLDAAIGRLDHLAALGVDLVELMPVNAFNGTHNWGYDGVDWFAVHDGYGGPVAYQRFVDACHQHGLGVVQDVVYNHLGPSGNYLPQFGPYLNQENGNTWGSTVNLDGEGSDEVRRFIIDNALMWLCDYHVDALRLDAVHALVDMTALHLLEELAIEVDAMSAHLRRPLTLIAESDLNDPRMITTREAGGYGLDAQWSDDFHHALIANLTGEVSGYYADFGHLESLAKVVQTGFYHDGTMSSFRGRRHGRRLDTPRTPCWRLVICSDNHDQIGNRADGARLRCRIDQRRLEIAAVLTLLSPGTPMIFQGEEWGASTPFVFFTSHPEPELAEATRQGRLEEFAKMDWDTDAVPDPQDPASFTASELDWSEPGHGAYAELLRLYTDLIRLRRTWPEFTDPRFDWTSADFDEEERWFVMTRGDLAVAVNFGAGPVTAPVPDALDAVLVADGVRLHPDTDVEGSRVDLPGHGWAVIRLAPVAAPPAIA